MFMSTKICYFGVIRDLKIESGNNNHVFFLALGDSACQPKRSSIFSAVRPKTRTSGVFKSEASIIKCWNSMFSVRLC